MRRATAAILLGSVLPLLVNVNFSQAQFVQYPQAAFTEFQWAGGTGDRDWQQNGNWDMSGFPNDTDPNDTIFPTANFSVGLGANLNVNVGTTPVKVAGLFIGGTSGVVTTEISSDGPAGQLIFKNYDVPVVDPNHDGDFDNDGRVSGSDLLVWQQNYAYQNTGSDNINEKGDANADDVVGAADRAIWLEQYGFGGGTFNEGAAFLHSGGVDGSINRITAPVHLDNEPLQIGGNIPLVIDTGADITFNGSTNLNSAASLSVVNAAKVTINSDIIFQDVDPNTDGIDFGLNTSGRTNGTLILNGVIRDADPNEPGRISIGGGVASRVEIYGDNSFEGHVFTGGAEVVLGHDNALGVNDTDPNDIEYALVHPGGTLISNDDNRNIKNDFFLSGNANFGGDKSLTLSGEITQTNNRSVNNDIESPGTLTFDGRVAIWGDGDFVGIVRAFVFTGEGTTKVTGEIRDLSVDTELDPNTPPVAGEEFRVVKRGSGVLLIDVDAGNNTHQGETTVIGGNLHYADNDSLNTGGGLIRSLGGAVGVDTGVASNTTFAGLIDPESFGGLMISASDAAATLDFTSTLANAGNMTVAAPETGLTFTGTIVPANSLYGLGGGEGTLTLPDPNQLTGANSVEVRNGGTVELLNDNNYTGSTRVRSDLVVDHLEDGGVASSIGSASTDPNNLLIHNATLKYVGTGDTTDRLFTIGTGGATIDSSGTGALVFENAGTLGRRDLLEATGTLNDTTGNPNEIVNLKNKAGGGDVRDIIAGMTVNDPDPGDLFGTSGKCGGPTGLEWGGFGDNDGSNCIPLYEDPNGRVAGQGGFNPNLDPNEYTAIDVTSGGLSSDHTTITISRIFPLIEKFNTTIVFGAVPRTLTLTGDNAGDNEIASIISDSAEGSVVSVEKTGTGKWILSGANTYTGDTIVAEGILSITDAFLDPNSSVYIDNGVLNLDFVGTNIVENLFFGLEPEEDDDPDPLEQAEGIWGAIGSGATFETSLITGSGLLNVGNVALSALAQVPEPSAVMLACLACLSFARSRRFTLRC